MKHPIRLNADGDVLTHYPDSPALDERRLEICIGVHLICSGWVDFVATTRWRNAMKCRSCGLRLTVGAEVRTYGDLRAALVDLQPTQWPAPPETGSMIMCAREVWPFKIGDVGEIITRPHGPEYITWARFHHTGDKGPTQHSLHDGMIGRFGIFDVVVEGERDAAGNYIVKPGNAFPG